MKKGIEISRGKSILKMGGRIATRALLLSTFVFAGCAGLDANCPKRASRLRIKINLPKENSRTKLKIKTRNFSIDWKSKRKNR